jgi:hypothetical protein
MHISAQKVGLEKNMYLVYFACIFEKEKSKRKEECGT